MLRLTGAILTAAGCAWIGIKKAEELKEKTRALREMNDGLALLAQELELNEPPMDRLMERLVAKSRGSAQRLFLRVLWEMEHQAEKSFAELWEHAVDDHRELGREGQSCLEALKSVLGQCGIPPQLRALDYVRRDLEKLAQQAADVEREQGKVFRVLGISGGAFLVTLLV